MGTNSKRGPKSSPERPAITDPLEIHRFLRFLDIPDGYDEDVCWPFTGTLVHGYGQFIYDQNSRQAHRISYRMHCGGIPAGMSVLHDDTRCQTKSCCNPRHLRVGTHAENIREAIENGAELGPSRSVEGSNSKLTADEVREIRRRSRDEETTYPDLAEEYDVSATTIYRCVSRRTYNDID